jgi:ribosome-associated protein
VTQTTTDSSVTDDTETTDPNRLAEIVAGLAADKKATDIVALDLRGVSGFTDVFVVCTGNTDRQVKAIHDAIHFGLKKDHEMLPRRVEGLTESRWVLMDYWDIVVHVFTPDTREFYRLEQLWGDVPRIELPDAIVNPAPAGSPTGGTPVDETGEA